MTTDNKGLTPAVTVPPDRALFEAFQPADGSPVRLRVGYSTGLWRWLPVAVVALLQAERGATYDGAAECPCCGQKESAGGHEKRCALDAALTEAGLPSKELRDAARGALDAPKPLAPPKR